MQPTRGIELKFRADISYPLSNPQCKDRPTNLQSKIYYDFHAFLELRQLLSIIHPEASPSLLFLINRQGAHIRYTTYFREDAEILRHDNLLLFETLTHRHNRNHMPYRECSVKCFLFIFLLLFHTVEAVVDNTFISVI